VNRQLRPSNRSTQQTGFHEPACDALGVLRPQRSAADVFAERILRVDLLELGPYPAGLVELAEVAERGGKRDAGKIRLGDKLLLARVPPDAEPSWIANLTCPDWPSQRVDCRLAIVPEKPTSAHVRSMGRGPPVPSQMRPAGQGVGDGQPEDLGGI
jgi:hypothetical protein